MLNIGLRATAALRSDAKDMSALEIMRSLPRHREAIQVSAVVAQKTFSDFARKYASESPSQRGAIFREFAYAVASGSFTGAMEPLASNFVTTFA